MCTRHQITTYNEKRFILFFGANNPNGVCSNHYMSNFIKNDTVFNCVEQFMMYHKAMLFGDGIIATKILKSKDPKQMKKYGRQVHNFDQTIWNKEKYNIVKEGVYHKFSSNPELKTWLLDANVDYFVECSPSDDIWGIKLRKDDPRALQPDKWQGQNLLGKAIMEVRNRLLKEYTNK